ncbi:hypothetical protein BM536_029540 [Streptomyces phaeoluteigriseus]|uniref:Uncharacterized protein n=1 Tax=Streptomyces phaeoluteigriseus TaxID=114686 RepID=A0A1V6MJA8_9ACTN|nr:hypothetical protein BM536_029540 [Streptomyces phaeoluteigriseus]
MVRPVHIARCFSGVRAWRRLRDWTEAGVWPRLHTALLTELLCAAGAERGGRRRAADTKPPRFPGRTHHPPRPVPPLFFKSWAGGGGVQRGMSGSRPQPERIGELQVCGLVREGMRTVLGGVSAGIRPGRRVLSHGAGSGGVAAWAALARGAWEESLMPAGTPGQPPKPVPDWSWCLPRLPRRGRHCCVPTLPGAGLDGKLRALKDGPAAMTPPECVVLAGRVRAHLVRGGHLRASATELP